MNEYKQNPEAGENIMTDDTFELKYETKKTNAGTEHSNNASIFQVYEYECNNNGAGEIDGENTTPSRSMKSECLCYFSMQILENRILSVQDESKIIVLKMETINLIRGPKDFVPTE